MKRTRTAFVALAILAASGLAHASPDAPAPHATPQQASASSENRALAETLFFTARGLMEAGRYPEACRKLGESYRLDAASGTLLNLALCHEKEGKIASAWGEYRQALVEARRAERPDREEICAERIAALGPLVPQLQIDVPANVRVRGLVVSRNGTRLSAAAWNTPLPTDAGVVEIIATAPGYKPRKSYVTVAPEAKMSTTIGALTIDDTPPPVAVAQRGWPALKTVGFVSMVLGVAGLGVGAAFGGIALKEKSTSDERCPIRDDEPRCSASGADAMTRANRFAWGSNIGLAAGGVALVGGGILFFAANGKATTRASLSPTVGGARLAVTF